MKRIFCFLTFILMLGTATAQQLTVKKRYGKNWDSELLTLKNKPNGVIYRLRQETQCYDLPPVAATKDRELFISEQIDTGWLALYRLPTAADSYDFVVVLYDHDKQPQQVLNLCDIANNRYCEVQDVRWDAAGRRLLFNMACPSYASDIGGKGSKLYSYSVDEKRIVWQTDYLVSNDIFILDNQYVYCSYGFTSEKKFLYLLDKQTGKVYSKIPMTYKVEYLELGQEGGQPVLYALDYDGNLFSFSVSAQRAQSAEPAVFTVVYATSDDGFLNVRQQPSMSGKILTKLYSQFHGLGGGVLRQQGSNGWSKVSVGTTTGWVYDKYLGYQNWYHGDGRPRLIANREPTSIYGENYADEGDYPLFTTVKKGTVIADEFDEIEGYYVLKTGHDYLFIRKGDVRVERGR